MSEIEEMKELIMHILLVQSLHNQAPTYHCKLTGDEPECLSRLIELDETGMHHLLHKCGLFDKKSKKYKMSGVIDQHDRFAPSTILNF
jgi:endonuclease III